jgi:hypothetical protein
MLKQLVGGRLAQRTPLGLGQRPQRNLSQAARAAQCAAPGRQRHQAGADARSPAGGQAGRTRVEQRAGHDHDLTERAFMRVVGARWQQRMRLSRVDQFAHNPLHLVRRKPDLGQADLAGIHSPRLLKQPAFDQPGRHCYVGADRTP